MRPERTFHPETGSAGTGSGPEAACRRKNGRVPLFLPDIEGKASGSASGLPLRLPGDRRRKRISRGFPRPGKRRPGPCRSPGPASCQSGCQKDCGEAAPPAGGIQSHMNAGAKLSLPIQPDGKGRQPARLGNSDAPLRAGGLQARHAMENAVLPGEQVLGAALLGNRSV